MTEHANICIRAPHPSEHAWLEQRLIDSWGSTMVVSRGHVHDASRRPALVAVQGGELVGLATFALEDAECELVTLDALRKRTGVGSTLLARVVDQAVERGCRRVWLITTNDNIDAIRFYPRRGMRIAVHPGAVDEARWLKPSISGTGEHGTASRSTTSSSSNSGSGEDDARAPALLSRRHEQHRDLRDTHDARYSRIPPVIALAFFANGPGPHERNSDE